MGVVTDLGVTLRRFNGWLDPRYPIGTTFNTGTGGGIQSISINFWNPATPLNANMYSLEQFWGLHSNRDGRSWSLRTFNMDSSPQGGSLDYGTSGTFTAGAGATGLEFVSAQDQAALQGIFLGRAIDKGLTSELVFSTDDTFAHILKAGFQGYYWDPRSVLVDGGPQRPPTGLYKG